MKEGFLGLNFSTAWISLSLFLSLPLDMLENFFITNFSLTSSFVGMYIEGDMFVSSSYYLYLMIFQFTVLVRWILNLNGSLIKYMNMEA